MRWVEAEIIGQQLVVIDCLRLKLKMEEQIACVANWLTVAKQSPPRAEDNRSSFISGINIWLKRARILMRSNNIYILAGVWHPWNP